MTTIMSDVRTAVAEFNLVLADDDEIITDALSALLGDHPGLRVVGCAVDGISAANLCADLRPHLAVLDVMMPSGGLVGLAAVRAAAPKTEVVFYTARADRRTRSRLLDGGALAVFAKGAPIDLAAELHAAALARFSGLTVER